MPILQYFVFFGCVAVFLGIMASSGILNLNIIPAEVASTIFSNIPLMISGLLGLACLIWGLCRSVVLGFYKGTVGSNTYGDDPLPNQPNSSASYWILGITLFVINIVVNIALGTPSQLNDMQQMPLLPNNTGDEGMMGIGDEGEINDNQIQRVMSGSLLSGDNI